MKKYKDQQLLWESYRAAVNEDAVNADALTDLREKLQEDLITYFAGDGGDDGLNIDEVLALIDDRFPASTSSARIPDSPWLDTDD